MFRNAERTFTNAERRFTNAECTFRTAEHKTKTCFGRNRYRQRDIIKTVIINKQQQLWQSTYYRR